MQTNANWQHWKDGVEVHQIPMQVHQIPMQVHQIPMQVQCKCNIYSSDDVDEMKNTQNSHDIKKGHFIFVGG